MVEFQLGLAILLVLAATLAWVLWRGAHPEDPLLFELPDHLLTDKGRTIAVYERPVEPWVEPGTAPGAGGATAMGGNALAPFPADAIGPGWRATAPVEMFDETNLYSKINGRETYYKALGFQKLHYLSLAATDRPDLTIDIELFDQGNAANALGAFSGEISRADQPLAREDGALWYTSRNSGFLVRGRHYARLIGSDDDPLIRDKVELLQASLRATLPAAAWPWAYRVFVGDLQIHPGAIRFEKQDAFALAFANDFYRAAVAADGTELFVSRRVDTAEARTLAGRLADGLGAYAERVPAPATAGADAVFMKHTYLNTFEAVRPVGAYVAGVRGAASPDEAAAWMQRLGEKLEALTAADEVAR